jgi:hypothetical protein
MSCSTTGLAMSTVARASVRRRTSVGLARTHPIRRPAQNALLIEPIVITLSPSGSYAATGAGAGASGSSPSSAIVSSTTSGVRVPRASATTAARSSAGSVRPVGLWWSATR